MNWINIKKRYSDDVNYNLNLTNSSYFLLTILLKNYWKKITAHRQQYYFTTSSIYHNDGLILPKLRHKNLVYILFRCHYHVK